MKKQKQMPQIASSRTLVERRLMQRLRHAPLGECLTFEQFLELAKHGRRTAGYYEQMAHIISCPACRRAYLELRVILQAQRPSLARWLSRLTTPRLPQWALATGFAGVVFAFAVWALYPKPASNTLIASNPPAQKRDQIAQLPQNSPENGASGQSGSLSGGSGGGSSSGGSGGGSSPNQSSPLQQELAQVGNLISRGAEALSRTLASLAQGGVVRGGEDTRGSQQIRILQPDLSETNLLEDTTPTLRWSPVEGATRYRLTLRRSDTGETVLEEELPATQTQFQLRTLAAEGEYELLLSAPRGEHSTLKITLQFRVMSSAERADLQWARQNATQTPLVAGLIFYQLERYQEALAALERAQQKYPNEEQISRALNNLRARTRR